MQTTRMFDDSQNTQEKGASNLVGTFPFDQKLSYSTVNYGPCIVDEQTFRLLGPVQDKRVLVLGCGDGHAAVALALLGAKVIAVDPRDQAIQKTREAAKEYDVRIELHQASLGDLAFIRADTIDLAVSIFELSRLEEIDRVFRQVHRVLKTDNVFVFSMVHPAWNMLHQQNPESLEITRSYFDTRPLQLDHETHLYPKSIGTIFTYANRANFRVDTLIEPEPQKQAQQDSCWNQAMVALPASVLFRVRKEGI